MSTNLQIIFQNKSFAVLNKPAGILTTPSRFENDDPRQVLGRILEHHLGLQVYPVHRLDFEVSGIVVFALSANSHREASGVFADRKVRKIYRAITEKSEGSLPLADGQQFTWKSKILRGKKRAYEHKAGKSAITEARVLKNNSAEAQWELHPVTGRPHQLRYDLSRHGFPILGDALYGSTKPWKPQQIALQAVAIEFPEEISKKFNLPSRFELPADQILAMLPLTNS